MAIVSPEMLSLSDLHIMETLNFMYILKTEFKNKHFGIF